MKPLKALHTPSSWGQPPCGLTLLAGLAIVLASTDNGQAADDQALPNIVLIVADDLGWNDVGYHNPDMRTPTLDRLAEEGVQLDCHYVYPVCTPTRVALMTGRYPSRFGRHCCRPSNEQAFPFETITIASALKEAGYETALCGKWHLGSKPEWGPNHYGFDHSYGSLAGAVGMYDHRYRLDTPYAQTWHRNHEYLEEVGHATDLVSAEAARLLQQQRSKPLFLYVPYQAVHTPLVEPPKWLRQNNHFDHVDRQLYAAAVTHMDDGIRRIVEAIPKGDNARETLVIFTSDNGAQQWHTGGQYPPPDPALEDFSSNDPLRGRKTDLYEGGIRVPSFVYWPGKLEPGACSAPLHAVDWLPTLGAMAGFEFSDQLELDGQDIWPLIEGEPAEPRELYWVFGAHQGIALRHGDWKLLRNRKKTDWELYNVANDPNEETNLAESEPERLQEMKSRIAAQRMRDAE